MCVLYLFINLGGGEGPKRVQKRKKKKKNLAKIYDLTVVLFRPCILSNSVPHSVPGLCALYGFRTLKPSTVLPYGGKN